MPGLANGHAQGSSFMTYLRNKLRSYEPDLARAALTFG